MATAMLLPMLALFKAADPATLRPLPAPRPEPWQRAAKRRRAVFLLLTLVSTVLATSIFADMQPDYDNAWLQYGQISLFALLSAWVVTGFMTAMMGFYVTIYGDKHALSAKKSSTCRWMHPLAPRSSCRSATRTYARCSLACAPPANRSR